MGLSASCVEKRGGEDCPEKHNRPRDAPGRLQGKSGRWSVISNKSLGPTESFLFAQSLFPTIVDVIHRAHSINGFLLVAFVRSSRSCISLRQHVPQIRRSGLANYSSQKREGNPEFLGFLRKRPAAADFEGNAVQGRRPYLRWGGRQVKVGLQWLGKSPRWSAGSGKLPPSAFSSCRAKAQVGLKRKGGRCYRAPSHRHGFGL